MEHVKHLIANKKILVMGAVALALIAALSGCTATQDYSNTTLTGQVTAIEGTTITVQLGEMTEDATGGGEAPSGEAPSGDAPSGEAPDGEAPSGDAPSGDASTGSGGEASDGTPPELPDGATAQGNGEGETSAGEAPADAGEAPSGEAPSGEAPSGEVPSGEASSGEAPSGDVPAGGQGGGMGGGSTFTAGDETATLDIADATITTSAMEGATNATIDDLAVDDIVTIEVGDNNTVTNVTVQNTGAPGDGSGSFGGGSSEVEQGSAANTIDADGTYEGETYTSTGDDENALRVTGATATLSGITVDKSAGASSNAETGDFYGMNAALLATDGAQVTIEDATVTSSAQNGNGIFSYGSGTVVNVSDTSITTSADNSGGIQTTGGGTMNASNLTVNTSGSSAAAIRSDRGGGTVNVDGGTYTSNGYNSPAVYSTADITVANATLTANNSEALVIEGQNSIALENCTVEGTMSDTEGTSSDENVHNVMIYQSMSGDAEEGTSTFTMTGGSLTSNNGDVFYVTNTHCIMSLSGVDIVNRESDGYLLRVAGNSASRGWGNAGANGAQVECAADAQTLEGDIAVDSISTLNLVLTNGSTLTGTINIIENEQGGTAVENNAVITVDEGCTWTLTDNCTVSSLTNNGTINFNGYTITLADGTVLS